MKKILLDRSIFHGPKFELLRQTKLSALTKNHTVVIYGNPMLAEETFSLELIGREKEAREQLRYILDITNGRWFRDREELFNIELEGKYSHDKYFFLNSEEQKRLLNMVRTIVLKGKLGEEDIKVITGRKERLSTQRENVKTILRGMREEVPRRLKRTGKKLGDINEDFDKFYITNLEKSGEMMIRSKTIAVTNKDLMVAEWKSHKERYPYFTLWMKAFLYMEYHAMAEQNRKIDINAISDIDQLIYLEGLDGVVSDDTGFMKDAFRQLYGENKHFLSSDQFLKFIRDK